MNKVLPSNLILRYFIIAICIILTNQGFSQTLKQEALNKVNTLNTLIIAAENANIDAYKEKMTLRTAETFLLFADWDQANLEENITFFKKVAIYKDKAAEMAAMLPDFEREEIILMLDDAIAYLTKLKNRELVRKKIPQIDWSDLSYEADKIMYNERPVFLEDYTWKPGIPSLTEYHGDLDGFFISPTHLQNSAGQLKSNILNDLKNKPTGTAGFIFLNHKGIPNWSKAKYGDGFRMREETFTGYDIDHPGAQEMMGALLDAAVPNMAGKNYSQLGYMLCNEPHFFTKKDAWATGPVSDFTIDKFRIWLENKHHTIVDLNTLWHTDFSNFKEVNITIPIAGNLQGTPIWYDWMRFNMKRVTDWYVFLKDRIRQSDPDAKVHLKVMPSLWVGNSRDHGLDFEALTNLSEIIGNDAGSRNNHMWGPTEWWEADYAFSWREMTMSYDFLKSVSPNKIIFNSEAHYLSTGKSRNLYEDPPYTRATYWLAHMLGLNAVQTWYWARKADGSIRSNAGNGYAGSNNQQPRIVNELHSTMMDLNSYSEEITAIQQQARPVRIFHSKTSAINGAAHMNDIFDLYKSLFFEGTSIGFATENIIKTQSNRDWEAIVIYKTEFVTESELIALQSYLDEGGILIKDEISITKNEYGVPLPNLKQSNGTIILKNSVSQIKTAALSILNQKDLLPQVTVSETNGGNTKGCHWKVVKNEAGNNVVSIVNMGKTKATLAINVKDATSTSIKDLLKGINISSTITLAPFEVLFAEVTDNLSTSTYDLPSLESAIEIFPNPSNGRFNINFPSLQEEVILSIFDHSGKLVFSKIYENVQNISEDISKQPSGSYVFQMKTKWEEISRIYIKQ